MKQTVSHDRQEESIEAKTRWFRSLTSSDRMALFCSLVDMALQRNPKLADQRHAQSPQGRVRVLSAP